MKKDITAERPAYTKALRPEIVALPRCAKELKISKSGAGELCQRMKTKRAGVGANGAVFKDFELDCNSNQGFCPI